MADEEVVEQVVEEKPDGSSQKNPLLTILLIVNAGLLGTVAYFQFTSFNKKKRLESGIIKRIHIWLRYTVIVSLALTIIIYLFNLILNFICFGISYGLVMLKSIT